MNTPRSAQTATADTGLLAFPSFDPPSHLGPQAPAIAARIRQAVARWRERARAREELAALDEHALADVGLTRAQVAFEASRPFWRE